MTEDQLNEVRDRVESQGFHYAMENYLSDIKDQKFQRLRKQFLFAAEDLMEYCQFDDDCL